MANSKKALIQQMGSSSPTPPPVQLLGADRKHCVLRKSVWAVVLLGSHLLCQAGTVARDYAVRMTPLPEMPTASMYDLAQTHYLGSSGTGTDDSRSQHADLFNGLIGNADADSDDLGEIRMTGGSAITVDFDVSEHTAGYDIREIDSYVGWQAGAGARPEFSIEFTFVDGSRETIDMRTRESNVTKQYWSVVSVESGESGPIAAGVKSITFTVARQFPSGEWMLGREIDIFGAPTGLEYAMVLQRPNGYRIPKILGASGDLALLTGYDYFSWYGITEHRTWFKPAFSTLADDTGITSPQAFAAATEAIRQRPMQQATVNDYFIDWDHFYGQLDRAEMPETMHHLSTRGIKSLITNTRFIKDEPITDDWVSRFKYWKYWYTMVYYFASQHDLEMYAFRNEPHAGIDYDTWESHWLVCADAMRKAMADVNEDLGKRLQVKICGPNCPGVYWDHRFSHPDEDIHCWGNVSWEKVKYDVYGNYNVNNPWNYGMYHYHRYGQDATQTEKILLGAREDIANARNDPNATIPLVITEYNTSTTGNFNRRKIDPEDLLFGVSMAQILQASAVHGPAGLGDDGGIFVFKLGENQKGAPLVGLGNKLNYISQHSPHNYGGVTRGGACFQMYARHFSGGKALIPVEVSSGASDLRRTVAVVDPAKRAYYIYGSNVAGTDVPVSIDLSALNVETGAIASLQRVDEKNTGQVTEILKLSGSKMLQFYAPNYTAFLIKVPMAGALASYRTMTPTDDTMLSVLGTGEHGSAATMNVSMHHADPAQRQVGLLRFKFDAVANIGQAFLELAGRNRGVDPLAREILHVYAVKDADWSEAGQLEWTSAPGLGQYHIDANQMGTTDGTGEMVDIEDNYAGYTSGEGTGLGITGEFIGALSFHSTEFVENYLDVSDYLNSISERGVPLDVTFVVVRIVRYNVNEYENSYYTLGDYHYDGRVVEIASKEHPESSLQPRLIYAPSR